MKINGREIFQTGYYPFHKDNAFNFQMNRFYAQSVFTYDELTALGAKIDGFESWIRLFTELGEKAQKNNEPLKAATCYRAAQFYTLSGETDADGNSLKPVLYEKCRKLYDEYYGQFEMLQYTQIPFQDYRLPVYYAKCEKPLGDIVIHGGYDTIAQEFLVMLIYLHELNYNVYFFEGPGQGEVLMRYDARMTPEWQHCTGAVLDYFGLDDVTLIGISLGGYLAPQAALHEPRIRRVVMYDLIYDFYGALLAKMGKAAGFFDWMCRHPRNILWKALDRKIEKSYFGSWLLKQGYAIYENVHTPCEYFNYIRAFNTREISERLTQDVLVLAGANDIYTKFYVEQLNALKNARSVTGRLFTEAEHADMHCQIGNMELLLKTITDWIREKSDGAQSGD